MHTASLRCELSKSLFTLITCEQLLSSMNSHVTLKFMFAWETLSTPSAGLT
ncbi:hypothetical protein PO909_000579 [Leuciscus waleckii]